MSADVVVSRELKSLREELSDTQRARAAAPDTSGSAATAAEPTTETADERELRDQLRELADEVTGFFTEAEKSISAHPAQSVIGALLVGILIGRLLPRR
jgi:ElaB/YqjD/DUF883 family membrane-anchored ribosome-binding protein